mmetsp:Transcript_11846/g.26408  ORF Transcript_11846/g.26408 Transcript_11846/m.26408 type:complete len:304 (+) Transcript_11846:346-1257(+)
MASMNLIFCLTASRSSASQTPTPANSASSNALCKGAVSHFSMLCRMSFKALLCSNLIFNLPVNKSRSAMNFSSNAEFSSRHRCSSTSDCPFLSFAASIPSLTCIHLAAASSKSVVRVSASPAMLKARQAAKPSPKASGASATERSGTIVYGSSATRTCSGSVWSRRKSAIASFACTSSIERCRARANASTAAAAWAACASNDGVSTGSLAPLAPFLSTGAGGGTSGTSSTGASSKRPRCRSHCRREAVARSARGAWPGSTGVSHDARTKASRSASMVSAPASTSPEPKSSKSQVPPSRAPGPR